MSATRWLLTLCVAACANAASGCGDDKQPAHTDALTDAGTAGDTSDGSVPYHGPVRGGAIPDAPDYQEPAPDDGPYDASVPCCEQTLSFAALEGETTLSIEADFAPLAGAMPALESGVFTIDLCMPRGVAVHYRLHATVDSDAGPVERVRVVGEQPSFEDAEGNTWNLFVLQQCE